MSSIAGEQKAERSLALKNSDDVPIEQIVESVFLKKRKDFTHLSQYGQKFICKSMVLLIIQHDSNSRKLFGITVSKKVGSAVKRNYVKRKLREVIKIAVQNFDQQGFKCVIIARRQILDLSFSEIKRDLEYCLKNLLKK